GADQLRHLVGTEAHALGNRGPPRGGARGGLLHQAIRVRAAGQERQDLAQQPLISSTGLGQEGLPLRRFALQCRVEQLLDLRPVGRAHVVMRLRKRAPARLQATGGSCGRDAWATEYHRLGLYSGPRKVRMKSLAEAEGRHEIMDRMSRLAPDSRPRWGAMSVG